MKLSEINKGQIVTINRKQDLYFEWPQEHTKFLNSKDKFTVVKITKGGRVYIQNNDNNKLFFTLNAINLDIVEEDSNFKEKLIALLTGLGCQHTDLILKQFNIMDYYNAGYIVENNFIKPKDSYEIMKNVYHEDCKKKEM